MMREVGQIKWFGGFNSKTEKVNPYGFVERKGKENLFIHLKQVQCNPDALKEKVFVTFKEELHKGKCQAIDLQLLCDEQDQTTLSHFFTSAADYSSDVSSSRKPFSSRKHEIGLEVAKKVLAPLSVEEQILVVQERLKNIPQDGWCEVIDYLSENALLATSARALRAALPLLLQVQVYAGLDNLDAHLNDIKAILEEIRRTETDTSYLSWSSAWFKIQPEDELFPFLPDQIKKKQWSERYSDLLKAIQGFYLPIKHKVEWYTPSIYCELNPDDARLARQWESPNGGEFEAAKMLSARAAEHVAKRFYEQLGYCVEDVALQQLEHGSMDWTTHDLLLDNEIPVDVKNARSDVNSNTYVEHTVPRFKHNRNGAHVRIAAILSPYLQLQHIKDPRKLRFSVDPIYFLGETSKSEIKLLEDFFASPSFEVHSHQDRVISMWLLNYPKRFYAEQDEHIRFLQRFTDWPTGDVWSLIELNPLPALLAAGVSLPSYWKKQLHCWQSELYEKMRSSSPPTLPRLYLFLLTNFLHMISRSSPLESFSPEEYIPILFQQRYSKNDHRPLGLYDPMNVVKGLCKTLSTLWDNRVRTRLNQFRLFRFQGEGLLQGREEESLGWKSIIAYCGGKIEGKGKCGFSPLMIGIHNTCPNCQKLICEVCGYCSLSCNRLKNSSQENNKAHHAIGNRRSIQQMPHDDFSDGPPPTWEEPHDDFSDDPPLTWEEHHFNGPPPGNY